MKRKVKEPLWGQFLAVRAELIDEFLADGKSCTEIARILSMDPGQVWLIGQRNRPTGEMPPDDARRAIVAVAERAAQMLREGRIK